MKKIIYALVLFSTYTVQGQSSNSGNATFTKITFDTSATAGLLQTIEHDVLEIKPLTKGNANMPFKLVQASRLFGTGLLPDESFRLGYNIGANADRTKPSVWYGMEQRYNDPDGTDATEIHTVYRAPNEGGEGTRLMSWYCYNSFGGIVRQDFMNDYYMFEKGTNHPFLQANPATFRLSRNSTSGLIIQQNSTGQIYFDALYSNLDLEFRGWNSIYMRNLSTDNLINYNRLSSSYIQAYEVTAFDGLKTGNPEGTSISKMKIGDWTDTGLELEVNDVKHTVLRVAGTPTEGAIIQIVNGVPTWVPLTP